MLSVASETVIRTTIGAFFFLVSKGWGTLHFDFDPLQATNCAKFLGAAYIVHSSYFVTVGADTAHTYIRFAVIAFYVCLIYLVVKATLTCLRELQSSERDL